MNIAHSIIPYTTHRLCGYDNDDDVYNEDTHYAIERRALFFLLL